MRVLGPGWMTKEVGKEVAKLLADEEMIEEGGSRTAGLLAIGDGV